jgi:hypothetical protein
MSDDGAAFHPSIRPASAAAVSLPIVDAEQDFGLVDTTLESLF